MLAKAEFKSLTNIGLTEKQAKLYIALLSLGEATVLQIAAAASIKRPTAYLILEQLDEMGFIATRRAGSRELIRALSPYAILDKKRSATELFATQIPKLLEVAAGQSTVPQFTPLSGPDGIQQAMVERLDAKSEIYFWASNNLQFTNSRLATGPMAEYMKERIRRKIWTRGLIPYEASKKTLRLDSIFEAQQLYLRMKKVGKKEYREFVFIPRQSCERLTEIWVFDDKVEFYSTVDFVGGRITSLQYAATMRTLFLSELQNAREREVELLNEDDLNYLVE